jgi:phospholipid/cholesterol/gamma-HCH transport system ATP-binding protein
MSEDAKPVLSFRDVTFRSGSHHVANLQCVNLEVFVSELVLVRIERMEGQDPLLDLAEGLLPLDEGDIRFLGESWEEMSPGRQSEMRGRIGRVFESWNWVSNLTVWENVMLSQLHHTTRSRAEVNAEAGALALALGLPGVPESRPELVSPAELRKAAWVRAFMGQPRLILLDRPEARAAGEDVSRLIDRLGKVLAAGSAAIWITADHRVWEHEALRSARRHEIRDSMVVPLRSE